MIVLASLKESRNKEQKNTKQGQDYMFKGKKQLINLMEATIRGQNSYCYFNADCLATAREELLEHVNDPSDIVRLRIAKSYVIHTC